MIKLLKSIEIEHYRGFANSQKLELTDPTHITFLVGQNNTGKSLISKLFTMLKGTYPTMEVDNTTNNDFNNLETKIPIQVKLDLNIHYFLQDKFNNEFKKFANATSFMLRLNILKDKNKKFLRYCYIEVDGIISHDFDFQTKTSQAKFEYNSEFGKKFGLKEKRDVEDIIQSIFNCFVNCFLVFEPIRAFDKQQIDSIFVTGNDLVKWLDNDLDGDKVRSVQINIRRCFSELNLEAPKHIKAENGEFIFVFDDLALSANEVGTGYSMLYILLMEILRNEEKEIVIIDEIESHLQPGLVRILIKILRDISLTRTNGIQYILATHSPSVLDSATEMDHLYRFQKTDGSCFFYKFFRNKDDLSEMRKACNDLGVIPGDVLLSNVVVWAEGPTEVHWLRALLREYLPEYLIKQNKKFTLIEGLHYSILLTGGGVIANLSFHESESALNDILVDHYIKVLRVNPNPFVIIDSDNSSAQDEKYKRSIRIANELNDQNKTQIGNIRSYLSPMDQQITTKDQADHIKNFWWLSAKEIENYCPPSLLKDFYQYLSDNGRSNVKGANKVKNWNCYSSQEGLGSILEKSGLKNIKEKSGTIIHKRQLAAYVFNNLKASHLQEDKAYSNKAQLDDLKSNLDRLLDYISLINDLK